ncbi:hypothetical protein GCM10010193_19160 [Kitasatospora atroaurantiaca]|uniref:LuxR C-terminal-related transcriptional regulator n=1 Tax=Kitasatospora atroaurantiaca TaxID=285545 RepID=UPI0014796E19|nr:LuxR C-terminal-related transcriptional regulator [Kitasatospora atroaurantiaca]
MENSAALYGYLLADPGRSLDDLRCELGWSEAEFESAVDELRRLGLLQPTTATGSGLAAVSVDSAVRQLLLDADGQVAELFTAVQRTRDSVEQLHARYLPVQTRQRVGRAPELVRGPDRIAALLEDAARSARTEALSLRPGQDLSEPALAEKLARERIALARGAELRTIYPAAVLRRPAVLAHLRALTAAGAGIRVAHALPLRLIVVDASLAVLPAPAADSGAAVVVRDPAVVGVVRELFEYFWAVAWVPPELLTRAVPGDRHREVLRLLAAGLTDEAIGRKLEISDRTVRRLVADLTADLGAQSRFQAGVHAARLGWL